MNEYLIVSHNPMNFQKVQSRKVTAPDIMLAISNSGFPLSDIISVKLNMEPAAQ